jgi:hypothetical protein
MTNRDRFRVIEAVYEELRAAGVQIDIGQLDWACREVETRLQETDLRKRFLQQRRTAEVLR